MKKILLIVFCSSSLFITAQTKDSLMCKNAFGFSPFSLAAQTLNLYYEFMYKDFKSIKINPLYKYKEEVSYNGNLEVSEGYGLSIANKLPIFIHHPTKNYLSKMYLAPFLMYMYSHERDERSDEYTITYDEPDYYNYDYYYPTYTTYSIRDLYFNSFSGGVLIGFDFTILKKLNIDIFLGGGLRRTKSNLHSYDYKYETFSSNVFQPGYNGVFAKIGFDLGIKF